MKKPSFRKLYDLEKFSEIFHEFKKAKKGKVLWVWRGSSNMIKKCQNVEAKTSMFVHFTCFCVELKPLFTINWSGIKVYVLKVCILSQAFSKLSRVWVACDKQCDDSYSRDCICSIFYWTDALVFRHRNKDELCSKQC